ncbi:MAG: hypothetical protein LBU76_05995 [Azoarcus sp.]|nr:hypothetical protein [Azoarcus sp.]
MNRKEYLEYCAECDMEVHDAGRDWYQAGVQGAYLCAIIRDAEDYEAMRPLIEDEGVFIVSAYRKAGNCFFEYRGRGYIYGDPARFMGNEFARFLEVECRGGAVTYYSAREIDDREIAEAAVPRTADERDDDYFRRVAEHAEESTGFGIPPRCVTEAGYYCPFSEQLLLSDADRTAGIWGYRYDNWEQCVIAILNDEQQAEE